MSLQAAQSTTLQGKGSYILHEFVMENLESEKYLINRMVERVGQSITFLKSSEKFSTCFSQNAILDVGFQRVPKSLQPDYEKTITQYPLPLLTSLIIFDFGEETLVATLQPHKISLFSFVDQPPIMTCPLEYIESTSKDTL
mmetsp:Transcript_41496/g.36869  ORF Transcript_41496/g.36869 Transcript_41496/m.36869 type:complete len:141 (-) Transcript_41496:836-1258(-)